MQKILPLILSAILLSACSSCRPREELPSEFSGDQLSVFIPQPVDIAGKLYIEVDQIKCWSRKYKVSQQYIGGLTRANEIPYEKCNLIKGYAPDVDTVFVEFMKSVQFQINNP